MRIAAGAAREAGAARNAGAACDTSAAGSVSVRAACAARCVRQLRERGCAEQPENKQTLEERESGHDQES